MVLHPAGGKLSDSVSQLLHLTRAMPRAIASGDSNMQGFLLAKCSRTPGIIDGAVAQVLASETAAKR